LPDPIILIVASAMVFAPVCSWLALQRGRSRAAWFAFGVLLGPVAGALLVLAPPGRCPSCGARSRGWPRRCEGCGLAFASGQWEAEDAEATRPEVLRALPDPRSSEFDGPDMARLRGEPRRIVTGAVRPGPVSESDRHAATALGHRPTLYSAPARDTRPREPQSDTLAILGSGIFVGGSEGLQIGSRYFIARVGSEMHMLGPIHISPSAVAARISLSGLATTVVSDRLLITAQDGGDPTLAFSSVTAELGVDLQQQLVMRPRAAAGR
jgi:hypothetical protein